MKRPASTIGVERRLAHLHVVAVVVAEIRRAFCQRRSASSSRCLAADGDDRRGRIIRRARRSPCCDLSCACGRAPCGTLPPANTRQSWACSRSEAAAATSVDLDLSRLLFLRALLRDTDEDHAVAAFRADALFVRVLRKREAARERAVEPLDAMDLLVLLALFLPALACQRQHAVLHRDADVFLAHLGHLCLDEVLAFGFTDVGRRRPFTGLQFPRLRLDLRLPWPASHGLGEYAVEHVVDVAERFPLDDSHDCYLLTGTAPAVPMCRLDVRRRARFKGQAGRAQRSRRHQEKRRKR